MGQSNLGGNELKTVGPATENARRANSVRTRGTNSRGEPADTDTVRRMGSSLQKCVNIGYIPA